MHRAAITRSLAIFQSLSAAFGLSVRCEARPAERRRILKE
uniref:Uncharacterized protein n=1 Tax=Arundo donax TaxID=35708 RepID=A0A0A9S871_ARUDO